MKRYLLIIPLLLIAMVVGLSIFLQPDDLQSCNDKITSLSPCQTVDAIVAVSGGDTNARTDEAIRLYKNGWSDTLIFSGAAQDKSGPSNAAAMQIRAVAAGVLQTDILLDEYSATTKQNAENTQTMFATQNIKSIILVTSGYHQRRAGLEFSKRATDVVILNHPVASDKDWSIWWWTTPRGWSLAVGELFKVIAFNFEATR